MIRRPPKSALFPYTPLFPSLLLDRLRPAAAHADDALGVAPLQRRRLVEVGDEALVGLLADRARVEQDQVGVARRSEEHTSELQSRQYLVCRLLLEKKKTLNTQHARIPVQYLSVPHHYSHESQRRPRPPAHHLASPAV